MSTKVTHLDFRGVLVSSLAICLDAQSLRLDDNTDIIEEDDPFTAKLSFEVGGFLAFFKISHLSSQMLLLLVLKTEKATILQRTNTSTSHSFISVQVASHSSYLATDQIVNKFSLTQCSICKAFTKFYQAL